MAQPKQFSSEFRQQLMAFAETLYRDGDPRAIHLMDEMRMVSHQIYQLGETSLQASGLSYAQYRILMGLAFNEWRGNAEGLNPSEISEQQGTSRNTISALIRTLEEEGLIARHLDHEDRRRFNIHLTEAGRQRIRDHTEQHIQLVGAIFAALTPEEMEALSGLLRKLNRCIVSIKDASNETGDSYASNQ